MSTTAEAPSLQSLGPGDRVIYHPSGVYGHPSIMRITRVTPTQIVVGNDRFNRETGWRKGEHGYSGMSRISNGTPEQFQEVADNRERLAIAESLSVRNWKALPLDKLRAIKAIIDTHTHAEVLAACRKAGI
jgi:hypothetical protein